MRIVIASAVLLAWQVAGATDFDLRLPLPGAPASSASCSASHVKEPASDCLAHSSVTQCPKCGAVATYPVTMQNGGQVLTCKSCRKTFTAEVKQGEFTGRNR